MYNRDLHHLFWFYGNDYCSKAYSKGRALYGRRKQGKPLRNTRAQMLFRARVLSRNIMDWVVK